MAKKITLVYSVMIMAFSFILPVIGYCQAKPATKQNRFNKLSAPADRETYQVSVEEAKPPYQVRINDIPIFSSSVNGPMTFFVNAAIRKSGPQTIKLIEEQGHTTAKLTVNVIRRIEGNKQKKDSLLWSGNNSGIFQAAVPYTLENWELGQDLNNAISITAGTKWFADMAALLKNRKGTAFMGIVSRAEENAFISNYMNVEDANEQYAGWEAYLNKGGFDVPGIADCKIEVVGDGKLLHLINKVLDGGISIISPNLQATYFDIFLYMPKGKTLLVPVLINFKQIRKDYRKS